MPEFSTDKLIEQSIQYLDMLNNTDTLIQPNNHIKSPLAEFLDRSGIALVVTLVSDAMMIASLVSFVRKNGIKSRMDILFHVALIAVFLQMDAMYTDQTEVLLVTSLGIFMIALVILMRTVLHDVCSFAVPWRKTHRPAWMKGSGKAKPIGTKDTVEGWSYDVEKGGSEKDIKKEKACGIGELRSG
ncbi:MAG: hypothetical protein LQ344_000783 [Seirophora lacunosa]|nr:MAG: hypothetical protein LQ344_000783 [Seirophora lacunosa]